MKHVFLLLGLYILLFGTYNVLWGVLFIGMYFLFGKLDELK